MTYASLEPPEKAHVNDCNVWLRKSRHMRQSLLRVCYDTRALMSSLLSLIQHPLPGRETEEVGDNSRSSSRVAGSMHVRYYGNRFCVAISVLQIAVMLGLLRLLL